MPTIRHLLDRYGQPPADVALDWAWQIRQRLSSDSQSDSSCLLAAEPWTQLEVGEDGQLVCDQLRPEVAQSALQDLRHWVGNDRADKQDRGEPEVAHADSIAEPEQSAAVDTLDDESRLPTPRQQLRRRSSHTAMHLIGKQRVFLAGGAVLVCLCMTLAIGLRSNSWLTPQAVASTAQVPETSTDVSTNDREPTVDAGQLDTSSIIEPEKQIVADALSVPGSPSALGQLNLESSLGSTESSASTAPPAVETAAAGQPTTVSSDQSPAAESAGTNDAMRDVQQTFKKAESTESVALASRNRGDMQDTHGDPWVLLRDTMRYRVTLSPKLNASRQSQWTLALEPIAGLAVEPQRPVTISAQGLAIWRIYETEAKSPRASLFVRALHHGRDGTLELVFCGGAEDMPGMSVPLAQRWLSPLTVRVQSQALELRGALARLSTSVITPDQVPAVMQRKQAMIAQMLAAARLGAVMPEINRLAELVDGQVTMHAELRSKPNEPAIATWGRVGQ